MSELNPLRVEGNRIIDAITLEPVTLRGVVRSGLEYSPSVEAAGITTAELDTIVAQWGANIIRLPFNQSWALARPGYDAEPYLASLDFVVREAASRGAYTLLDLQWLDAVTQRGKNNFVPPLPDELSILLWEQLAARYAGESSVLYDIFNEPHDPLPDDPIPLPSGKRVTMRDWQPWAKRLIDAVRQNNPNALIFVSGVNWAYDLRGFPIPGREDVVYSTHVYRNKGSKWDASFGNLSATHPVFAAEWGCFPGDEEWGLDLLTYFERKNIGWTAWSWADQPHLIQAPLAPDYLPTAFGRIVQAALRNGDATAV